MTTGKGRRQDRAAARRRDRQYRLAPSIRGQRGLFLPRARLRARRPANGSSRRRSRWSATTPRPTTIRSPPRSARSATVRCIRISPTNTRNGPAAATGRTTSRNGSRCTASCSRTAFSASRMSAAISTRSPASAAPSRSFPWNWDRGDGCIIRLVAIIDPKGNYRIEKGEKFDDRPQVFRGEVLRRAQSSRLFLAASVRRRSWRLQGR